MRVHRLGYLVFSLVLLAGCKTTNSNQPANAPPGPEVNTPSSSPASQAGQPVSPAETSAVRPKIDACALLTSKEIESVQGEEVKETKLSGQSSGGLIVSQCFFTLPTFNNSISLVVSHKGEGAGAREPRESWREIFHETKSSEREREEKEEEEGESTPPQKVRGVGTEAFWLGSRIGGSLYVLKGNSYVRISIGGPAAQSIKLAKSKTLAQKALARL